MESELTRLDQAARERALDVSASFVVQAPAGSGKTSLLTQRLLALLAAVDLPEEILAITFTRKAAGEMRTRIVEALRGAESPLEPANAHERTTWALARKARARSTALGWSLELQPSRLKVQTIDALAQSLARAMPILSRAGASLDVETEADVLYDEATLRLMGELEQGGSVERNLATVLEHFDNDYDQVRRLFAAMLERRDHWLPSILIDGAEPEWRARLEQNLARVAAETLRVLADRLPADLNAALWASAIGAASRWPGGDTSMSALAQLTGPAPATADALALWQRVARVLLIAKGDQFRRRVDKNCGFPPTHRSAKDRHRELLAELAELPGALEAWRDVAFLPPTGYDERQWRVVAALLALLKRLTAHLRVIFTERGAVDYTEVALAAREALGQPDQPTDLALRLDYRVRHILVDEFQDTSLGQVELLRRLTAGWTGTDGRTLFCVGDPMQSIYRFRQADVALFLRVRHHGIENLQPATLTLTRNFRSAAGIVDWVNQTFAAVLPAADDFARGAVGYTPVQSTRPAGVAPAVHVWPAIALDPAAEAQRVLEIVRGVQTRRPQASIAVLARTRSHLQEVAATLRAHDQRFQAIDFEVLSERRAVRDLCALTRALCHRDDRISWLAILRAPFCGLRLPDLEVLAERGDERTLWEALNDRASLARLSAEARTIIARVVPVLAAALDCVGRRPLATLVEGTWLGLGGPASVEEAADLENARVFFDRLAVKARAGDLVDPELLDDALVDLHAAADVAANDRLQLITIHRAKGLEWDVVIVPGLGRQPRGDSRQLLYTLELEHAGGATSLILAPARPAADDADALETFVRRIDRERAAFENARLMYVAATRARAELHLLGHIDRGTSAAESETEPKASSLLKVLWPAVHEAFSQVPDRSGVGAADVPVGERRSSLRRLAIDWRPPPAAVRPLTIAGEVGEPERRPDFDWVSEIARLVGIVVHRDLDRRVRRRLQGSAAPVIDRELYAAELRELGAPADRITTATERVVTAVHRTLADERGRWILAPHPGESSEWALTAEVDGALRRLVVDRSFIDDDGARWIIDYKTGGHEGGAMEIFLDQEAERYTAQLARYAKVVSRLRPEPVRAGLYFPLLGAWRELDLR
ncbi:MAG: UvrD-helicase domain-containing protein [Steroidobacteraceae bacterium]